MTKLEELRDTFEAYLAEVADLRRGTKKEDLFVFRLGYEYGLKVALAVIQRMELEHDEED